MWIGKGLTNVEALKKTNTLRFMETIILFPLNRYQNPIGPILKGPSNLKYLQTNLHVIPEQQAYDKLFRASLGAYI